DNAMLMFKHAEDGDLDSIKQDLQLHSEYAVEKGNPEPTEDDYKFMMENFDFADYATNFNLNVIDFDKLSETTQIEIGEDYGGEAVLISVVNKNDELPKAASETYKKQGKKGDKYELDEVLIMAKYNGEYKLKDIRTANTLQNDIVEQMYADDPTTLKSVKAKSSNRDSNNNTDSIESTGEKGADKETQNLTSDQQKAINAVKKSFKDAEDQNLTAFKEDMSHYDQMPSDQVEGAMHVFGPVGYTNNYTFRIIDFEDFPETSEFRDSLLNEYGNQFIPISVTNNKDTLSEEALKEVGSLEGEQKILEKIGADSLVIVENYDGEYKIRAIIPAAFKDAELAKLMYAHDPDTWSKVEKAMAEAEKNSQ
ncbi:hypothetical protein, partial [Priestia megaterium]|uniref:hypothetical protein n=1 Tax=Priestia megaterium TaxID=1404 RepID=UPI002FFFF38A